MNQLSLFDTPPRRLTVKGITAHIRQRLEGDATLQNVWVEGEISNWKPAASGHIYFTLKDREATMRCVIWRAQVRRLRYQPRFDGEAVAILGRVSVYDAGGNYQFYVDDVEQIGQGDLQAEFERIKRQLTAEGLFDASLKQPLPPRPQRIGLVTSPTGAALQDMLNVLRRRYPLAEVILAPTLVQGAQAPTQIVAALQAVRREAVEVIIMARGGGSLEDLWAFNDEQVARAIAACPIPIVTGIGHEVDFTIADFVADMRAPTPSAAAELVVPEMQSLREDISRHRMALHEMMTQRLQYQHSQLQQQQWALARLTPRSLINNQRQRLDDIDQRLLRAATHQLKEQRGNLQRLTTQLTALNPTAVLARGYAIVQKGQRIITEADQLTLNDEITLKFQQGDIQAIVI